MTNKMIHTPEGVRDIYGDELTRKNYIRTCLHQKISSYGYLDIETPTFEYFDTYNDVGTTPSKELYKFFDKEGNILALRSDFTPSIARCCTKYFLEDSMPVRLCYQGNSFSNNSDLQGKLKETTEIGVELIDNDGLADYDAEVICLSIELLQASGLKDFQITIGQIDYFKALCDEMNLNDEDFETLRSYISLKNYFGAQEFLESLGVNEAAMNSILDVSSLTTIDDIKNYKSKITNDRAKAAITRLEEINEIIRLRGYEKYISYDLSLINKFHYYTGVIFRAYTYGVGDAVIKGGRYDNLLGKFGKNSKAIGFSVLIDDLLTALKTQGISTGIKKKEAYVVYNTDNREKALAEITKLRSEGVSVTSFVIKGNDAKEYQEYAAKMLVDDIKIFV